MHDEFGVFLGLDVGKEGHHAVGLNRDGKRLHDAALRGRGQPVVQHHRRCRVVRQGQPAEALTAELVIVVRPAGDSLPNADHMGTDDAGELGDDREPERVLRCEVGGRQATRAGRIDIEDPLHGGGVSRIVAPVRRKSSQTTSFTAPRPRPRWSSMG